MNVAKSLISSNNINGSRICVLIIYLGKLPEWFDLWRHTARENSKVDFILIQDQLTEKVESNIRYINLSLEDINKLPQMRNAGLQSISPYKLCDYRPMYAHLFPEFIKDYAYWGWGDLDVIYGDIHGTLGSSFGEFDYISTGWKGESGPLAFLRNCEEINSLWQKIPGVQDILRSQESYAMDEKHFVELLRDTGKCDIEFRECLHDLPSIWKNGHLVSKRSGREYTLHHFGGHVSNSQSQIIRETKKLLQHVKCGGALKIKSNFKIKKVHTASDIRAIMASLFRGAIVFNGY